MTFSIELLVGAACIIPLAVLWWSALVASHTEYWKLKFSKTFRMFATQKLLKRYLDRSLPAGREHNDKSISDLVNILWFSIKKILFRTIRTKTKLFHKHYNRNRSASEVTWPNERPNPNRDEVDGTDWQQNKRCEWKERNGCMDLPTEYFNGPQTKSTIYRVD